MKKDPAVFIGHILDSIEIIEGYSEEMSEADLMESVDFQDKIIRRIEIIGEAVKNLPEDLKRTHSEIPMARYCRDEGYSGPSVLWGGSRICLACGDKGHPRAEAKASKDSRRDGVIRTSETPLNDNDSLFFLCQKIDEFHLGSKLHLARIGPTKTLNIILKDHRIVTNSRSSVILDGIPIIAMAAVIFMLIFFFFQQHPIFPYSWFSFQFAATAFAILFCLWILCEIANFRLSRKNSGIADQDRGSYRVVIIVSWTAIFAIFIIRSMGIGVFGGIWQDIGFFIFASGIAIREWAVWVLGKHFTVRVQIRERAKLVTSGPYRYIRHPSYTGSMLIKVGISLAVGTWVGAIFALALTIIAHSYRINIEEQALQGAFGPEWDDYKNRTWKLIPGF